MSNEYKAHRMERTDLVLLNNTLIWQGLLNKALAAEQWRLVLAQKPEHALLALEHSHTKIVAIDFDLDPHQTIDLCQRVHRRGDTMIVGLSTSLDPQLEAQAFALGVDEYLRADTDPSVISARLKHLLAVHKAISIMTAEQEHVAAAHSETQPKLQIQEASRTVLLQGRAIPLTTAEYELLHLLAQHQGQVVNRDDIYQQLRGIEYDGVDRSIDLRVARLRKKLGGNGKTPCLIKSIRGEGYVLASDSPALSTALNK